MDKKFYFLSDELRENNDKVKSLIQKKRESLSKLISPATISTNKLAAKYIPKVLGGSAQDFIALKHPVAYSIQENGIYRVEYQKFALFMKKAHGYDEPLLYTENSIKENGFVYLLPKIPIELLLQSFILATDVCAIAEQNVEVMTRILWDTEAKKYFLDIPIQVISGAAIKFFDFDEDDQKKDSKITYLSPIHESKNLQVMQIHSHNSMGAFHSETDDKDNAETRFYGVIGNIFTDPTFTGRWCMMGKEEGKISLKDLFDTEQLTLKEILKENDLSCITYPEDALSRIAMDKPYKVVEKAIIEPRAIGLHPTPVKDLTDDEEEYFERFCPGAKKTRRDFFRTTKP